MASNLRKISHQQPKEGTLTASEKVKQRAISAVDRVLTGDTMIFLLCQSIVEAKEYRSNDACLKGVKDTAGMVRVYSPINYVIAGGFTA
jgi:hypothetical protein